MENLYSAPHADLSREPTVDDTYQPQMFSFVGRIGRLRYLAYHMASVLLAYLVFAVCAGIAVAMTGNSPSNFAALGIVSVLGVFLLVVAMVTVTIVFVKRRLNDCGVSGWWGVLALVPFVNFLLSLYLIFAPGTKGLNEFGPAPAKNTVMVVIGSLIFPLVMIIGIVAAIALPAYKGYTDRAKAAQSQSIAP